ncbi:formyltransferase family protein [Psychrobacter submarinus]|uniref:formyltransferase family protein n=1 Tax=Psychrobacter submarinus TaxID=154108 RepID=UPI001917EBD9|nr:formyltransferase family protein [Psychrobacter submarinus]
MKIIALIGDQPNHKYLCERMHQDFALDAVIIVNKKSTTKNAIKDRLISKGMKKVLSLPLSIAWRKMQASFQKNLNGFTSVERLVVDDVNSQAVVDLVEAIRPELVVVSGTNLLTAELIMEIGLSGKIMNLHTGLSPYVKGGPNCTNWCLANNAFQLIGNTVMWLDEGIDSGNLIRTERTPLLGNESLLELHKKVMTHGHDLLIQAIASFTRDEDLPNIEQDDIDKGRVFYSKQWTAAKIAKAYGNFLLHYKISKLEKLQGLDVLTVGDREYEH